MAGWSGISRLAFTVSAVVVVALVAAAVFIALTQYQTQTSGRAPPTAATTAQAVQQTPGGLKLPSEITLWKQTYADQYSQQVWESLYREFEKQYGIRIKVVTLEPSDGNNKMNVALEAGSPSLLPDVSNMIGELAMQVRISQGKAEPLDDIYEWLKQNWGDDLITELFDKLMYPGPDGKKHLYLIPWGFSIWSLNVHVDYIEMCGVTIDDLKTFDRFNASLYKLRDCYRSKGLNIIPFDLQISPQSLGDSHQDIDNLYRLFSGHDLIEDGRITINATQENHEAFQKALLTLKRWYEDGILPRGALTELDLTNNVNFINGLTAMTWNNVGTMIGAAKRQHPDWKFAVVPLPTTPKHPQPFGDLQPRTLFIPADRPPEYKEAAKLFIKFILNRTNYEKWYGDQGGFEYTDVPIYRSLLNRGAYLTDPVWKGVAEVFRGGGKIYMWSRFASMTFGDSYNRAMAQVYAQNVVIGAMSAKEATDRYVDDLFRLYQKWGW